MSDLKSGDFGYVCSHGNLERKCEICEKDAKISKLEKELVELKVKRTCPVCWNDTCVGVCEEDFARAKHEISALESKLKSAVEGLDLAIKLENSRLIKESVGHLDACDFRSQIAEECICLLIRVQGVLALLKQ